MATNQSTWQDTRRFAVLMRHFATDNRVVVTTGALHQTLTASWQILDHIRRFKVQGVPVLVLVRVGRLVGESPELVLLFDAVGAGTDAALAPDLRKSRKHAFSSRGACKFEIEPRMLRTWPFSALRSDLSSLRAAFSDSGSRSRIDFFSLLRHPHQV